MRPTKKTGKFLYFFIDCGYGIFPPPRCCPSSHSHRVRLALLHDARALSIGSKATLWGLLGRRRRRCRREIHVYRARVELRSRAAAPLFFGRRHRVCVRNGCQCNTLAFRRRFRDISSEHMLRRLLDRELGVVKHDDRLGRPPPRIYVLQRPIPQSVKK